MDLSCFSRQEHKFSQAGSHQYCLFTKKTFVLQVTGFRSGKGSLECYEQAKGGVGRDHLGKTIGYLKTKSVLTTPLSDLVFTSSLTTPKPGGGQKTELCESSDGVENKAIIKDIQEEF